MKSYFLKIYFFIKDFTKRLDEKNITTNAAATTFYLFLSLIPMLILLCGILPYTPLTEGDLMIALTDITPEATHPLIIGIIRDVYSSSAGIVSLAALVTAWSAGRGVLALMRGLNAVNGAAETRPAFVQRLLASAYTVIILSVLILSLIVMVFGNTLINILAYQMPSLGQFIKFILNGRFLIVFALLSLSLALIYAYIPGVKTKLWMQLPGAALAAWCFSLLSFGFSIYVDYFNAFSIYGSLTTIVMILMWLFFGIYVILLGAYINKYFRPLYLYLAEQRKKKKEDKKSSA
ncbi:MAG: YihY/virulence factor BrkB family protein [Lachnospiraceae bacterium]|nr:YihY/virulence factor BrkB family protein [Lachnospiraceae bacterium]